MAGLKDLEQEAKLQAVVFADSLDPNPKFRPITLDLPKVLAIRTTTTAAE